MGIRSHHDWMGIETEEWIEYGGRKILEVIRMDAFINY